MLTKISTLAAAAARAAPAAIVRARARPGRPRPPRSRPASTAPVTTAPAQQRLRRDGERPDRDPVRAPAVLANRGPHPRRGPATVRRPLFANVLYPRFRRAAEESGEHRYRERLLDGLTGRVLELGCGDGAHFPLYPETVAELVAVEPEENLLRRAEAAAAEARCPVRIVPGFAEDLPAVDGEFDAAVAALVLCSVDDQREALSELKRVIRPGGEVRFFEHVRADARLHIATQVAVQPLWAQLGGGCHIARDTEGAIRAAGFEIERIERFEFAPGFVQKLAGPHILGVARRP